jgi:tetratricopeptide (TPR) repeat protein
MKNIPKFIERYLMNSKKVNGKYLLKSLFLAAAVFAAGFLPANAQEQDKQEKIKVSADEQKALKKIESAKTLGEKIKATDEFVKKYPQSPARNQAARYLAGQIIQIKDDAQLAQNTETYLTIFTEPEEADLILPNLISSYVALKRYKDAYANAEKFIARNPEEVFVRLQLAVEGTNLTRTGTKDFASVSRDYAVKAIELIEANKRPAGVEDAQWSEYQTKWLPQLYQSAGILTYDGGDRAKALVLFEKAAKLNSADVNNWILIATIRDDEYQALAQKYNAAAPGAARDELLKQANAKMDETIEMFARVVALTEGKPEAKQVHDQVRQNLEQYYKYRHKNLDGLNALIAKYKN